MVPFKKMVYVEDKAHYFPDNEVPRGTRMLEALNCADVERGA